MKNNFIHDVLLVIGLVILAVMICGYPLMWLWNGLMPTIFNLPQITFWQAVGLNLLSSILFKTNITKSKEKTNG
jgi:hypothetical protein